ncbi:DNA topoisomerase IB [Rarobacter faecitabidus]|uniref:DNA topoisomerase n=1 Tax=Rarobacter faecitabidus TaxID=13243 RepID=A0A542ZWY8_RARFA|nr:DNA topoisomerase IB [Rarobacter faecitabidus]TQL64873.1 DNA topoisomerase-1 [Rarobacter faecitabidus]
MATRRSARRPIGRESARDGFVYHFRGRTITDPRELERIESLAIPPAWQQVEIARSPKAKVLAVGIDAAGRRQAIYNPSFRRRRDRQKFARMIDFGEALPELRARVDKDLASRRLSKAKAVACVVKLLDEENFRVGNRQYSRRHGSYGVTTLRREHVRVTRSRIYFDYTGKSAKHHQHSLPDPRLARAVGRLLELPGEAVFKYRTRSGRINEVTSKHINAYIKKHAGSRFSAKDFRTWGATRLAVEFMRSTPVAEKDEAYAAHMVAFVADRLGNTPAVARGSYIHPVMLQLAEAQDGPAQVADAGRKRRARKRFSVAEQCALQLLGEHST